MLPAFDKLDVARCLLRTFHRYAGADLRKLLTTKDAAAAHGLSAIDPHPERPDARRRCVASDLFEYPVFDISFSEASAFTWSDGEESLSPRTVGQEEAIRVCRGSPTKGLVTAGSAVTLELADSNRCDPVRERILLAFGNLPRPVGTGKILTGAAPGIVWPGLSEFERPGVR
jgi:hypothetical protein